MGTASAVPILSSNLLQIACDPSSNPKPFSQKRLGIIQKGKVPAGILETLG